MTPKKLLLRNFIGIRSGLNRDELVLDIDALAGGAELVAIIGPNGTGKTTVLDSLQPFRVMPFRAGGYSPGSFSFYDNVHAPQALKELIWEHEGTTYRSTLVFKQPGKTRKTEAYLHMQTDNDWTPYTAPDGTVSDGKTDTYDRCIEAVLGSPDMFFTSAFSTQGRKTLASYGNGEIKGLMSELLGLDKMLALGAKANDVAKGLRAHYNSMADALQRVTEAEAQKAGAAADLKRDRAQLKTQMTHRQQARAAVQSATRELAEVQATQNANAEVEMRRSQLEASIRNAQVQGTKQAQALTADISDVEQQTNRAQASAEQDARKIDMQIKALNERIEKQRTLLARKNDIESAAQRKQTLTREEAACQSKLEAMRAQAKALGERRTELAGLAERLSSMQRSGQDAATNLTALQKRSALTAAVPCAGTDLQPKCQLLSEALAAKASLSKSEQHVKGLRAQYQQINTKYAELKRTIVSAGDVDNAVSDAEQSLQAVRKQIAETERLLALRESVEHAAEFIDASEGQIKELLADRDAKQATLKQEQARNLARIKTLTERAKEAKAANAETIARIEKELDALPAPLDSAAIEDAEKAVEAADTALSDAEQAIERLNAHIATAEANMKAAESELARAGYTKVLAAKLESEIAHWSTLQRALSNDGIIALSIDDAGPTLASLTNDLLTSCYGPRFTVRIDTQRQAHNGNLKEAFDITVFDAEREDEKSVRMASGGERIWINEALTRAIALYQAQTSGQSYGCLFADESDGALDTERKQQFMRMKRKVLELGGYRRELFISHTPELWDMADALINLEQFKI